MKKFILNLIPTLTITLAALCAFYDDFFLLIFSFIFGFLLPIVALVAFFSIIYSCCVAYKWRKAILSLHIINITLILILIIPSSEPIAIEMEKNYEDNRDDIFNLSHYAQKAINDSCCLNIEYDLFHPYNNKMPDSAECVLIGLNDTEQQHINRLIRKADCKGIRITKESVHILYKRVGFGAYSYVIPLSNNYKSSWENHKNKISEYSKIEYNDTVLFIYESGAIGSDNFVGKDEYLEQRAL